MLKDKARSCSMWIACCSDWYL